MHFSLAPIKYRNIFICDAGPISRISYKRVDKYFESYASLDTRISGVVESTHDYQLYGNVSGTGTDKIKSIAAYKAISEALERWAYIETVKSKRRKEFAFDIDPTTTGMAAYPYFTATPARENALNEAIERWALVEFWNEKISSKFINTNTIELITPFPKKTIIVFSKQKYYSYGFATAKTLDKAIEKANIELHRNENVLSFYDEKEIYVNTTEKRLIYFSTEKGFNHFISKCGKNIENITTPSIILDKEIKGKWSKYTRVWRILLSNDGNKDHFSDEITDFFYF